MSRSDLPEKDYGPPIKYDPTFNGPIHRRSCTDIICLGLFILFMGVWVAVSIFAINHGDVRKLLVPTDSLGRKCGLDSGLEDYPYLVFFDMTQCLAPETPITGCPTTQACVKRCPSETLLRYEIQNSPSLEDISTLKLKLACKYDVNIEAITTRQDILTKMDSGDCAENVFKSKPILGRCLGDLILIACSGSSSTGKSPATTNSKEPSKPKGLLDAISGTISDGISTILSPTGNVPVGGTCKRDEKAIRMIEDKTTSLKMGAMVIEDIVNAKWWIVLALVIVMFVCLIYITLMRWIAGPVVWFTLLAIVALLSYCIYLSYTQYIYFRDNPQILTQGTNASGVAKSITSMKETWLVIMIAACITLAVVLLMLIFLRKRIVLAVALIKEASRAVGSIKSSLFFPIFPWAFEVCLLALGVVVCLYLASIGDNNYKAAGVNKDGCSCGYSEGDVCEPTKFIEDCSSCKNAICHFVGITNPQYVYWMQAINVSGFFWAEFFVEGVGDMILAGAFATWYWTFKKSDVPFFTLTNSMARTMIYNLGTVAFGSLIITICRLIRLCLEYIDQKTKQYDNPFSKAILCCCKCFFACLESFLKFINKNAYIMCAIHGKGFISSAKNAFSLLMRNIVRVFVLDKVTDFLFFLSKLVVSVGCGAAAYYALTAPTLYDWTVTGKLHYDLGPALIVAVGAYLIASVFFGVYSMAVDTLFLCFLEDCERNDGSPERPYFMSKRLMKILGKKNKKIN